MCLQAQRRRMCTFLHFHLVSVARLSLDSSVLSTRLCHWAFGTLKAAVKCSSSRMHVHQPLFCYHLKCRDSRFSDVTLIPLWFDARSYHSFVTPMHVWPVRVAVHHRWRWVTYTVPFGCHRNVPMKVNTCETLEGFLSPFIVLFCVTVPVMYVASKRS